MKKYIFIIAFLITYHQAIAQQIINHVFDPTASAIRGVAIPGMLTAAIILKKMQSETIIPAIIHEEQIQLNKWRKTVFGNANTLNALKIASNLLITRINIITDVLPIQYAPGFRKTKRKYKVLLERAKRLDLRVLSLVIIGTAFIDGEGYYRVASQRLAIEYLEVYSELSQIHFKLTKLITFISLLPYIVK